MRETQVNLTPDPAAADRKIARAHSATEVDKAIFDVVRTCRDEGCPDHDKSSGHARHVPDPSPGL